MAQAISVILKVNNEEFDLSKMGLLNMSFDRYVSAGSSILPQLDLVMQDATGGSLLPIILDNENGKLQFKYGFTGDTDDTTRLSRDYVLDIIKVKPRWTNRAMTLSIGAVGRQLNTNTPPRLYPRGTSIQTIVEDSAKLNGWFIGDTNNRKDYVDLLNLKTDREIFKRSNQTDYSFLQDTVLPMCNRSITTNRLDGMSTIFWEFKLVHKGSAMPELYFRPANKRTAPRTVWEYQIGVSSDSAVLDATAEIDLSFLINGMNIRIPSTTEALLSIDQTSEEAIQELVYSKKDLVQEIIDKYNLPILQPDSINFTVEVVESEDLGNLTIEEIILQSLDKAMQAVATMDLKVIGNPDIMPNDLVSLHIVNADGNTNIFSSGANGNYWKVVGITEDIGLGGYTTTLRLVREVLTVS